MNILCFGSLNIDNVYSVQHFVRPGETMDSLDFHRFCGGKGLNQSIAASRAGGKVWHAGCVGNDAGILMDALHAADVNTDFVVHTEKSTGHAIIQVNENGQNCILLYGGANKEITRDQIHETLSHFKAGDFLILQNEINNLEEILISAKKRDMIIVLNPSPMSPDLLKLPLEDVDYFLLNEVEAKDLCGTDTQETSYPSLLLAKYPKSHIVLTLGSHGCIYTDHNQRFTIPAYKVNAVDTTGAGDTFTGYFIASLANGNNIEEALILATCASAMSVTKPGASSSIPALDAVLAFKKSQNLK